MKKFGTLAVVVMVCLLASSAWAASLSYSPQSLSISAAPGETKTAEFVVAVSSTGGDFYVVTPKASMSGSIPSSWVSVSPTAVGVAGTGSVSATLTVAVPSDASGGTYTGVVYSGARGRMDAVSSSEGVGVTVEVTAKCSGVPVFGDLTAEPAEIKASSGKTVTLTLKGTVTVPSGCTLSGASYTLDDEYGVYSGSGAVGVAGDGSFSASFDVKASRKGSDKDGRVYSITLGATDEAGSASSGAVNFTVLHDQRSGE